MCPACKTSYETTEIEQNLVEMINRKLMAYVLQDLQCTKCNQVKISPKYFLTSYQTESKINIINSNR